MNWDDCAPVQREQRLSKATQGQEICVHTTISRISMSGSIKDTPIMLTLRMVGCRGPETGRHSVFLSNSLNTTSKCNRAEKFQQRSFIGEFYR